MEFTDRYEALGMPYPNPKTMCGGQCEGIGRYPVFLDDDTLTDYEKEQWHKMEKENPTDDGAHFIICPDCNGTGKEKSKTKGE